MHLVRSAMTTLGFSALTAVATVTALWPRATFADDDATRADVTLDGTKVDDVVVLGQLVRDPKSKTGWVVLVEAENRGTKQATAGLETNITRQVMSADARVGPMPTAVWKKKETITIAVGEKATRRYDIPAPIAAKVAASAKAAESLAKMYEEGREVKRPPRITSFAVDFRGAWADDYWTHKENFASSPYGDSLMMPPMPLPVPPPPGTKSGAVTAVVF